MSEYLQLESLTLAYGKSVAVENLCLSISKGELVAFLGPSGCGKSTTMRAIAGLMKSTRGSIVLDGRDITRTPANKRDVGMVFQSYALFPHLNVTENVAFGLRLKRLGNADITRRVSAALDMVGLGEFAMRMPAELSGGQQQRVALARALVMDPKVLLLDEPLSNLDARLRLEMRSELQRVQQQTGLTMIFVTHDQVEAMSLADRIVVMNQGKVEQIGTPETIYNQPATRFVADFVGFENILLVSGKSLHNSALTGIAANHSGVAKDRQNVETRDNNALTINETLSRDIQGLAWRPSAVTVGIGPYRATVIGSAFAGTMREYLLDTPVGPIRADVSAELPTHALNDHVNFDLPVNKAITLANMD